MRDHAGVRHGAAILLSAFLLFLVQPLLGQAVLPWFGGSPATWLTCLVAFQGLLLAGYAWAHLLDRLAPRTQVLAHAALLLLVGGWLLVRGTVLPAPSWRPTGEEEEPALQVLLLLAASVGPPYLLLSATTPLLQGWYARLRGGPLPYRLYALSNLGSFAALMAHPFLLQPRLDLPVLGSGWAVGFLVFVALALGCGVPLLARTRAGAEQPLERGPAPDGLTRALWVLLPACASALLLATTNQLCQDVSAVPLLVLLPLGLYLLSFVLCFEAERLTGRGPWLLLLVPALAAQLYARERGVLMEVEWRILAHCGALFVTCVVLHGEVARLKPAPGRATAYYLSLAAGGALGGAAVALCAPRLFASYLELPISLLGAAALILCAWWRDPRGWPARQPPVRRRAWALVGLALLALFGEALRALEAEERVAARVVARSFHGVLRVEEAEAGPGHLLRWMVHGQIDHGAQWVEPPTRRREPVSYYWPGSGVGRLFAQLRDRPPLRLGMIGLGSGALSTYARPGDRLRFYELDPLVERLAEEWFTYLSDARARGVALEVELGDARVSLEREPAQAFDLLVLDAFSGDAVPTHLLTREALELYLRHLDQEGVLALHITNRSLDLRPQVEALARAAGLEVVVLETPEDRRVPARPCRWALLSRDRELLDAPLLRAVALSTPAPELEPWRDAWCDILPLMR